MDFRPDGSLCHMLAAMYKFKFDHGWRRFDLSSPSRKEANLSMCAKAEEALVEQGIHLLPKVYFTRDMPKNERERLSELVNSKKLAGWEVVDEEADATHIIHPSADPDDAAYCRAVFKKGDKCMVHFYRMPESHDNWGLMFPPEDKDPPDMIEEREREEVYRFVSLLISTEEPFFVDNLLSSALLANRVE